MDLGGGVLSGILTLGGTILGISRNIPQAMPAGKGKTADLTQNAVDTYKRHKLDALVCIGGKETIKAGLHLSRAGLNIVVLPKAADNDVPGTDKAIGFDTAREIATQAIDRLHSTANATHRIMIVELAGVSAGWLTLGAGRLRCGCDPHSGIPLRLQPHQRGN
jgi:6-phosphofructokinase 1